MRLTCIALLALLLLAGAAAPAALAYDSRCEPCPRTRTTWVERTIEVPAVTRTVRRPVYETVDVPAYGTRCVPVYRDVRVPVWRTREVPVFRSKRTPRYRDVPVPVYATRSIPLTREVCDPCTGERTLVTRGCRMERYRCGTRMVRTFDGWDHARVPCGTRQERYQDGYDIRRVRCGTKVERVQTGTRAVTRFKSWTCETLVVCPARTRVVRECVRVPCDA